MKSEKVILIFLSFLLAAGFVNVGCKKNSPAPPKQQTGNSRAGEKTTLQEDVANAKIILTINDNQFSNKDFRKYIRLHHPELPSEHQNLRFLSRIFDSFVERKLILTASNGENIEVKQEEIDNFVKEFQISGEKIDQALILESLKVQKYLDNFVYKEIDVTPEETSQYYNSHIDEFTKDREVLLYQIFMKDKDKALNVRSMLENEPDKFEELARSSSESIEAGKGGLMGYFEKGILPKEMEDVVFSLKINEISPVTESPYGYHIFKVTKQKRGGRLLYYKNVEPEIKEKLLAEKLNQTYQNFLNKLKKEMRITINYETLFFKYQEIKGET